MKFSVVAVSICLVLVLRTGEAANVRRSPSGRQASFQKQASPMARPPSRNNGGSVNANGGSIGGYMAPHQMGQHVGPVPSLPTDLMPTLLGRILEHVRILLNSLSIQYAIFVKNVVDRLSPQVRQTIANGLAQFQTYLEQSMRRAGVHINVNSKGDNHAQKGQKKRGEKTPVINEDEDDDDDDEEVQADDEDEEPQEQQHKQRGKKTVQKDDGSEEDETPQEDDDEEGSQQVEEQEDDVKDESPEANEPEPEPEPEKPAAKPSRRRRNRRGNRA